MKKRIKDNIIVIKFIVIFIGILYILHIILYTESYISIKILEIDSDPVRTALGIVGAGLVIINIGFIIIRIKRTEEQIKESQRSNYLNMVRNGIDMLYDKKDIGKQFTGINYLHNLAKANKKEVERIEEILEIFCIYIRSINTKTPLTFKNLEKIMYNEIQEILNRICKSNTYPSKKIDFENINLQFMDLSNANFRGANLKRAKFVEIIDLINNPIFKNLNIERSHLFLTEEMYPLFKKAIASGRGKMLQFSNTENINLEGAHLDYAILYWDNRSIIPSTAKGADDIIWVHGDSTPTSFTWRGHKQVDKKKIIEFVKKQMPASGLQAVYIEDNL